MKVLYVLKYIFTTMNTFQNTIFLQLISFILFSAFENTATAQDLQEVEIDKEITEVQPMTGIVFWPGNSQVETDAISLEFSYMLYNEIVSEKGVYDWSEVETLLDEMAARNHQAVLRFRFTYPGKKTAVPDYIKALADYNETEGTTEGQTTWFPDWTHQELIDFTIEFYERYAEKYDGDPRLAFVQTGFGLWAEYHIYDGPSIIGETFPSKDFQASFFKHLDTLFVQTNWSISIDAASSTYSPFSADPDLLNINFGLFDDSFMHSTHSGYNTQSWNFFDRERYKTAPAGGEFSYYSDYDQKNVLNEDIGAYGIAFETFVEDFHMSYINGNDQNRYQSIDRIKDASMYMGYRFKINSFKTASANSIVEIKNVGVAPIYYDAYVTVNGVRATESLKYLSPGENLTCEIASGGSPSTLTIESDYILPTQEIEYYGTVNEPYVYVPKDPEETLDIEKASPTAKNLQVMMSDDNIILKANDQELGYVIIYDLQGKILMNLTLPSSTQVSIPKSNIQASGILVIRTNLGSERILIK
ncbi:MAG: DUF4832 domain-containing protein [Cyclobacteriaceae bacterium]